MPKAAQIFRAELIAIVEGSIHFQRHFELLKLLQNRKKETESQLKSAKLQLQNTGHNSPHSTPLLKTITSLYRKLYGLTKEKMQLCQQFQELIAHFRSQLDDLVQNYGMAEGIMHHRVVTEQKEVTLKVKETGKARVKQMKLRRVMGQQSRRDCEEQRAVTTLESEDSSSEVLILAKSRKM